MPGTLFIVATPIGNLEDITLRALRVLREADLIAAEDTRHTANLLRHYDIRTQATSFHEHNERDKLPGLVGRLERGERIALVSDAGTPSISDPGYRLVRAARDAGIRIEVIPGASAAVAALVASGLPTDSFKFLGFPPVRSQARIDWLKALAVEKTTVVFFESPRRVSQTLRDLARFTGPTREVVVARELTKTHENLVNGPIFDVAGAFKTPPRGEITIVLAPDLTPDAAAWATDGEILSEFGRLTDMGELGRRQIIQHLAEKYGVSPKSIYQAIENARASRP